MRRSVVCFPSSIRSVEDGLRRASSIKAAVGVFGSFTFHLCLQTLSPPSLPLPPSCHHRAFYKRSPLFLAMADNDMWHPCNVTAATLEARVVGGLLRPVTDERMPEWLVPLVNDREPNPPPGYVVCFLSLLDGVWDSGLPVYACPCALLWGGASQLQPQFNHVGGRLHHGVRGVPGDPSHWNL